MKLGLVLPRSNTPPLWRESYRLCDKNGVVHMGLITCNDDLDQKQIFVMCEGWWTTVGVGYKKTRKHITCIECSMFRIEGGYIHLWALG